MAQSISNMKKIVKEQNPRSAWDKAVQYYALRLLENAREHYGSAYAVPRDATSFKKVLLAGAKDWKQYSWGGMALVYNYDIAKRVCSPSEFKKTNEGMNRPNSREEWLDTQARALYQAELLIMNAYGMRS